MAQVFVSYAHADRPRVATLTQALEQSGHTPWWDRRIESGTDYALVIERELAAADRVVVAWSATARSSLWVRAEANEALESGKLVQLSLDGAKLPLPFTMLHCLDFAVWRGGTEAPWPDLEARLADGGTREAFMPVHAPSEQPGTALQGLGRAAWLGWGAIGLAAAVAAAILLAARGTIASGTFAALTLAAALLSAAILLVSAGLLLRVAQASRR